MKTTKLEKAIRPTIKDVAKKCNLSITTVSLLLNNKPTTIPESTKKLVFQVAEKLNYRPNQLAVSMVTKKTNTIGLIIPDISNVFFGEMSKSIEDEAIKYGYTVIYGNTNDKVERDIKYVKTFIDKGVDGIILVPASEANEDTSKRLIKIIDQSNIPLVLVDRIYNSLSIRSVIVDHKQGAYIATRHLLDLGHKKIGCLCGPLNLYTTNQKLEGYKKALHEFGIEFNPELIFEGNFKLESGFASLPYFLKKKVSAIFAHNDLMALGIYKNKKQYNIKIPDDLSIVGFDNIFVSDLLDVPLTTIEQPNKVMGREAFVQLLSILKKIPTENKPIIFTPLIKIRKSTAPIR